MSYRKTVPTFPGHAPRRSNGHEEERVAAKQVSFPADRREIKELGDWRGEMLSRLRTLVKEADPDVVEEWKWRGVPVVAAG